MIPARTIKALNKSITIWEQKRDATDPENITLGCLSCPLCVLFHPDATGLIPQGCRGCPIAEFTGHSYCVNTPYEGAEAAWDAWLMNTDGEGNHLKWKHAAQKEIDFLKEVRQNIDKIQSED